MTKLTPSFPPSNSSIPTPRTSLRNYAETDRSTHTIPSPLPSKPSSSTSGIVPHRPGFNPDLRSPSTTNFYLLTPSGPQGGFHRNAARTVHALHRGRGRYVIIHADENASKGQYRLESFIVDNDVRNGERLQWVVEGGKFKASFLLPDCEGGRESQA
ncbi:hypothetical protein WAI453_006206 [Rhynchosporium graminicola]|uniref:DUF985 domain-containing protein n=1 Tax=Rhynchosporium graminicola TaxID=2792576 RepID=A0A1E1L761_9HELO|nr:uncharacterized protein RCO7_03377 [Rhynchosporium commune]